MIVADVAITASPISAEESKAAWRGVLPMPKCRSIFSISTTASSTKLPTANPNPNRVILFRV